MNIFNISSLFFLFFFFNDTATTEIYTLSLHDALPISVIRLRPRARGARVGGGVGAAGVARGSPRARRARRMPLCVPRGLRVALLGDGDRKSTRLNSSHLGISYAVFCLKKKKKISIGKS